MSRPIIYEKYQKVGQLLYISEVAPLVQPSGQRKRRATFQCECGVRFDAIIDNVKSEKIVSCECKKIKRIVESSLTHGLTGTTIYRLWQNMKTRCYNPKTWNFKNYGGRGINVCDEWTNSFEVFHNWCVANGHQKGLQLDRIDNDGNYEPSNCRFVTPKENCANRIRGAA